EGPSRSPEARQNALNNLAAFLGPILRGLYEYTGMHATVFMGGPVPACGGDIRVHTMCVGSNHGAVGLSWQEFDPAYFESVKVNLMKYLSTAFTQAEKDAAALNQAQPDVEGLPKNLDDLIQLEKHEGYTSEESSSSDESGAESTPKPKAKKTKKAPKKKSKAPSPAPSGSDADESDNETAPVPTLRNEATTGKSTGRATSTTAPAA
ncbi:hypothetical protein FB107DRAFT_280704, partial [Schizophyllum commune]